MLCYVIYFVITNQFTKIILLLSLFFNFFFIKINITLNFLMVRDVPKCSVFRVLSTAKSNKAVYKLIMFIIHSKYFPNSDSLKAHA